MRARDERGVALVLAMMAVLLLATLGLALTAATATELMIAANYRIGQEAFYAADAAAERALSELPSVASWDPLFDGSMQSTFVDGPPSGVRTLADGSTIDLAQITNVANCGKKTACAAADLTANLTGDRPWGANNPVWRLYAYDRLSDVAPGAAGSSIFYVVVFVGDDSAETDGDPLRDGSDPAVNPGSGAVALRAVAFAPRGAHRVVELTASRPDTTGAALKVLSWREIR
jgi:PilX N-terminal